METYIIMSGLIAVFLAISAVIGYRDEKQRDQKARRSLAEAFGKPGSKEYPDGRLAQIRAGSERRSASFRIDDITWNDLDMDLVYRIIDRKV